MTHPRLADLKLSWVRSKLLNACAPDSIDERAINLPGAAAAGDAPPPDQGQSGGHVSEDCSSPGCTEPTPAARSQGSVAAGCAGRSGASRIPASGGAPEAAAAADRTGGEGGPGAGSAGGAGPSAALAPQDCEPAPKAARAAGACPGSGLRAGLSAAQALQNCELALNAARAAGCSLAAVAAQDVAGGSEAAVGECLWQFIRLGVLQVAPAQLGFEKRSSWRTGCSGMKLCAEVVVHECGMLHRASITCVLPSCAHADRIPCRASNTSSVLPKCGRHLLVLTSNVQRLGACLGCVCTACLGSTVSQRSAWGSRA